MTKKRKVTRRKRETDESRTQPTLSFGWKDWVFRIVRPQGLKYGRTFLYLAGIVDLLGAIIIVVKALKDTCWIWIVTTFACVLVISAAFILFVMILATTMEGAE